MKYPRSNKEIIVITGAGQGIGKEIAKNLDYKYDILLISKSLNCKKTSKEILKKDSKLVNCSRIIKYLKLDLEKNFDFTKIEKKINFKEYHKIHLILCAGIVDQYQEGYKYTSNWKKVFNINLFSNIHLINSFLKFYNKKQKQNKIIVFSGGGAASSFKKFPIYSASKTALVRTVENYSEILSKRNISIFAIAPGAVKTKMLLKVQKIAKVQTKSKVEDVVKFINKCLQINTNSLNGKLVHIKDDLSKISKNKNKNYLKLRRIQ